MNFLRRFAKSQGPFSENRKASASRKESSAFSGSIEKLECRRLLTTWLINTVIDDASGISDGLLSLREAVIAAETNADFGDATAGDVDGDQIFFNAALSGDTINLVNGKFQMTGDLTIGGLVTLDANNLDSIFEISSTEDFSFTGLTLKNGTSTGEGAAINYFGSGNLTLLDVTMESNTSSGNGGGALFNDGGTVDATRVTFIDNHANGAAGAGGAIHQAAGQLNLNLSTVEMNSATISGGGIEIAGGSFAMVGGAIDNNTANPDALPDGGNGGGLHVSGNGSDARLQQLRISGNVASADGGGIWNSDVSTVIVKELASITDNVAGNNGGGIYSSGGLVRVLDSAITANSVNGETGTGGGLYSADGVMSIRRTTISGNTATQSGGGAEIAGGFFGVIDATFGGTQTGDGNDAAFGGGIHIGDSGAHADLFNVIVRNNTADNQGGGIWNQSGSQVVIRGDSIINRNRTSPASETSEGGGIFNNNGVIVINDGQILANRAQGSAGNGGGIYSTGGNVSLTNTVVAENEATDTGGGIYAAGGLMQIDGAFVRRNQASNNGGGIAAVGGAVKATYSNTEFNGNISLGFGGGIYNENARTVVRDASFVRLNVSSEGGGVYTTGGLFRMLDSTITANTSNGSGGGLTIADGLANIRRSVVRSNSAIGNGGGLAINGGAIYVMETVVGGLTAGHGNVAGTLTSSVGSGGGLYVANGATASLNDSTVTANVAHIAGGGIWAGGSVNIAGVSAVSANYAPQGGGIYVSGLLTIANGTVSDNLASDGGGIYVAASGTAFLDTPGLIGNRAFNRGGGGFNAGQLHLFDAGQVSNNQADVNGGGLFTVLATGNSTVGLTFFSNNTPNHHAFG